jgi:ABC-2 type transport system permease protein
MSTRAGFGHVLGRVRHLARAYPTLVRVGVSDLVAYRAEFLVWILTMNLPLIMMALWSAVAADGPIGRFGQAEFVAYYLAMFLVRILTGGWLVWELTMELKRGTLATRLMRPMHPLWAYSAEQLAAVPIRTLLLSPVLLLFYWIAGARLPLHDPARLAIVGASLVGAWLLLFLVMAIIGSLAAYVESALSVFDLWLSAQAILSGFLVPLELMPAWVNRLARVLPFRYLLGFPVEVLIGLEDNRAALRDLGRQWLFVAGALLLTIVAWRRALRRFAAFGG